MKVGSLNVNWKIEDLLADYPFNNLVIDLLNKVSLLLSKKERRWWRCGF
jgi:hypothetical protein